MPNIQQSWKDDVRFYCSESLVLQSRFQNNTLGDLFSISVRPNAVQFIALSASPVLERPTALQLNF